MQHANHGYRIGLRWIGILALLTSCGDSGPAQPSAPDIAVVEVIQRFGDRPLRKCRECPGKLEKLISRTSFQLKGGGWYAQGYSNSGGGARSSGKSEKSGKAGKSDKAADGGESKKAGTKAETSAVAASA